MKLKPRKKFQYGVFFMLIIFSLCLGTNSWAAGDTPIDAPDTETIDDFSLGELLNMDVKSVAFFTMSAKTAPNTVYIVDVPEYTDGAFRTSEDILYMDAPV